MADSRVLYWLSRLRSLCAETPERQEFVCVSHAASGIGNGRQFDYMDAAREHTGRYMEGEMNLDRLSEFVKGLFCLITISHALRYLERQDTRDETRVTRSPIPPSCYAKMLRLENWSEMVELIAELAEHVELASESERESRDLEFARLLREQAEMIRTASWEETEETLRVILK